jgi:hypothetical protein
MRTYPFTTESIRDRYTSKSTKESSTLEDGYDIALEFGDLRLGTRDAEVGNESRQSLKVLVWFNFCMISRLTKTPPPSPASYPNKKIPKKPMAAQIYARELTFHLGVPSEVE